MSQLHTFFIILPWTLFSFGLGFFVACYADYRMHRNRSRKKSGRSEPQP